MTATCRHTRPAMFCRKGVLIDFAKLTEKQLRQKHFLIQLHRFRLIVWFKKDLRLKYFPITFLTFENSFFIEQYWTATSVLAVTACHEIFSLVLVPLVRLYSSPLFLRGGSYCRWLIAIIIMIDTNAILREVVLGLIVPGSILKICISLVFAIYSTPQLAKWHYFV